MSFPALTRLDFLATSRKALPRAALPIVVAAAIAAAAFVEGGSIARLTAGVAAAFPLAAMFGVLLGASSLASDARGGSLRAVLMRPVSRTSIACSRAVVLVFAQLVAILFAAGAAWATARAFGPFAGVSLGVGRDAIEIVSADELSSTALRLVLAAAPAALVAPLVGLLAAAWIDDVGGATLAATLVAFGPAVLGIVGRTEPAWWFAAPAATALSVLSDLSEGVRTRQALVEGWAFFARAVIVPLAWGAAAVALAAVRFERRDFRD